MAKGPGFNLTYKFCRKGIRRDTQIIYPKDAGYILLRLDIFPGKKVGEAGTGSAGLTLIMARTMKLRMNDKTSRLRLPA